MQSGERAKGESFKFPERTDSNQFGSGGRDFLRSNAQTPLSEEFWAAGLQITVTTNCDPILQIARNYFTRPGASQGSRDRIQLRVWVDPSGHSSTPWSKPYFRGLDHLVFIGLDTQSSFLLDLRARQALGRLTPEIASNSWLWKAIIFPVLLTAFAGAAGKPTVHTGCVVWKGKGVLLAGNSGSGKSTLSLALAQAGFKFVSDDRTILSLEEGRLLATGLSPYLKLRPEALVHFPSIGADCSAAPLRQENAIYINPEKQAGVEIGNLCEPETILWLEQQDNPAFSIEEVSSDEIAAMLAKELPVETSEAIQAQKIAIDCLAERECFLVKHGGSPHETARELRDFLAGRLAGTNAPARSKGNGTVEHQTRSHDPLRRYTETPLWADFRLMRRHIRVETNCPMILEQTRRTLDCCRSATSTLPDFVWRIVKDSHSPLVPPWPEMSAFSDRDRRYINLGHKSFIAVDLDCREGVAHVSEGLVKDQDGFASIVLASMFYLCAGALGLTAISSACVASDGKGLLLFGVPRSGKTTSCFIARGHGYEFHADQAVFIEMEDGAPKAWGDFWPAAFHAEASTFVPGLADFGRPFVHRAASYLCAEKDSPPNGVATCVLPVACILLERGAADPPKLIPLTEREFTRLLERAVPFTESTEAQQAVRQALLKLPAFRLQYDHQPSTPASFFHSLLSTHHVVECLG